jgi:hypothetical protein
MSCKKKRRAALFRADMAVVVGRVEILLAEAVEEIARDERASLRKSL